MADFSDIGTDASEFIRPSKKNPVFGAIERYGSKLIGAAKKNLENKGAVAGGALKASIRFETKILGTSFRFSLFMEDYGVFVDQGTKPRGKFPPFDGNTFPGLNNFGQPFGWIQQKGLRMRDKPKGMSRDREMKTLAFLIARKIKEEGTRETKFFSDAVKENSIAKLQTDLSRAMKKSVTIEIQKINKEAR